jgi:hypothetical protein
MAAVHGSKCRGYRRGVSGHLIPVRVIGHPEHAVPPAIDWRHTYARHDQL